MRPDKTSLVNEVWDDQRIESFLEKLPMGNASSGDCSVLLNTCRSMRPLFGNFSAPMVRPAR
ncbi:MAG: hypothetical protein R3E82_05880 [Pseudomonadales bacterium]